MAQFVAFDPNVEVLGRVIMSAVAGLGKGALEVLRVHGLGDPQPDQWYSQQAFLDTLKALSEDGLLNLVAVGMKIPENAEWPPDIDSLEAALASIDEAYHLNHRGGEIGHYLYQKVGERHARLTCTNPYPSDFDYGLIYATTRLYSPPGTRFYVVRADSPCRLKGDDTCLYDVTW
jgi:hypothetical protein